MISAKQARLDMEFYYLNFTSYVKFTERPFWESLEDFQTEPHSILVF